MNKRFRNWNKNNKKLLNNFNQKFNVIKKKLKKLHNL